MGLAQQENSKSAAQVGFKIPVLNFEGLYLGTERATKAPSTNQRI